MFDYISDTQNDITAYFQNHSIPDYFYQCLFGELIKVWGVTFLIPNKNYDAECDDDGNLITYHDEDYSYKDQIDYFLSIECGTGGWYLAFKETCKLCDLMWMHDDYCTLDWVRSDYFDDYIENKMIEILFSKSNTNDYYKFRTSKGE